jgi:16S rRNA (guanine527-N7)-methyltransferase
MAEQFAYLGEKYGVQFVKNEDYTRYNNTSSMIRVVDRLCNTYICCSDQYYEKNPFLQDLQQSAYAALYANGKTNEYCLELDVEDGIRAVQIGGADAWYMAGFAYFSEDFSMMFGEILTREYAYDETKQMYWEDVYIKHFLDSVVGEKWFFKGANVIEIGSGGGFPSIPLKILRDDLKFTLVESTQKKCNHLVQTVDKLGLKDVKVMNIRAEDGGKDKALREKFDCVCARAVARLNTLCEYCLPFVKKGGRFIAYKGECKEELEEAKKAIFVLGGEVEKVEEFCLPDGAGKRSLIVIKKVKNTPVLYPRGNGKERKRPIV